MYFIATVGGQSHLWRQRFPDGQPEQITFGPAEEEGLAVEPNGRSIITSIGIRESSIWVHDPAGERSLSSEGEIVRDLSSPVFAPDHTTLYYLLRRQSADAGPELWRVSVDTGKSDAVLPGISMANFGLSLDGKQVVYAAVDHDGKSQTWLAPIDRSSPPRHIGLSGELTPHFGPNGEIIVQRAQGNVNYLERMNQYGSARARVIPNPISEVVGVSPGHKWLTAIVPTPESDGKVVPMVMAIPLDGGPMIGMCASYCVPRWSSNGKFLIIPVEAESQTDPGRSLAIPVGPGESLPPFPAGGIEPMAQPSVMPGSQSIHRSELVPEEDLSHFAYVKTSAHRNLYRVSLP
jgi:hypothetical protein